MPTCILQEKSQESGDDRKPTLLFTLHFFLLILLLTVSLSHFLSSLQSVRGSCKSETAETLFSFELCLQTVSPGQSGEGLSGTVAKHALRNLIMYWSFRNNMTTALTYSYPARVFCRVAHPTRLNHSNRTMLRKWVLGQSHKDFIKYTVSPLLNIRKEKPKYLHLNCLQLQLLLITLIACG